MKEKDGWKDKRDVRGGDELLERLSSLSVEATCSSKRYRLERHRMEQAELESLRWAGLFLSAGSPFIG